MRVLHFMNIPFSVAEIRSGGAKLKGSGGWMATLLAQMLRDSNNEYGCAAFGRVDKVEVSRDHRLDCITLPNSLNKRSPGDALRVIRDLTDRWKPDLIHIHGTESLYGLLTARKLATCPSIISLQGLLGPYSERYHFFGKPSIMEIVRMHRCLEIMSMRGLLGAFVGMRRSSKREREIIKGNRFFLGRTKWDRAYVRALNPSARYFHGESLCGSPSGRTNGAWDQRGGIESFLQTPAAIREKAPRS